MYLVLRLSVIIASLVNCCSLARISFTPGVRCTLCRVDNLFKFFSAFNISLAFISCKKIDKISNVLASENNVIRCVETPMIQNSSQLCKIISVLSVPYSQSANVSVETIIRIKLITTQREHDVEMTSN